MPACKIPSFAVRLSAERPQPEILCQFSVDNLHYFPSIQTSICWTLRIENTDGDIIGMGNNDVPKFGGGLYSREDGDGDHRCFQWRGKICHNDFRKEEILSRIAVALGEAGIFDSKSGVVDPKKKAKAVDVLHSSDVRNLIEFSRAVHAEMEAIISVARNGKAGLIGGTLYSTSRIAMDAKAATDERGH
jgi:deoxycytidylate deaminase